MTNTQQRWLAFAAGLVMFGACAGLLTTFLWLAEGFIVMSIGSFPWKVLRILFVVATVLAFLFACSDEAVD